METTIPDDDSDEQFYRDTESIAFPRISDHQLAQLEPLGHRRVVRSGEILYRAGERNFPMQVILSGELEAYETREDDEQILATITPRNFVGEISMLNGTSAIVSIRGKAPQSEILEIPANTLRKALADLPGIGEPVVQAFIMRRRRLGRDRDFTGLRILANPGCQGARRIDDFLDKNHIPHRLVDSTTEECHGLCDRLKLTSDDLPALIAGDGAITINPSIQQVARIAGLLRPLCRENEPEVLCDLAIVGAGPAGLASAVNGASEGLKTVVLESFAPGGQAGSSSLIENYFGFPTGISGGELTYRAQLQAYRFNAKFTTPSQVISMTFPGGEYGTLIEIEGSPTILRAKCVIIATGAQYNKIDVENLGRFEGLGVFHAATSMEAQYCNGRTVVVVGAGNSAGQAAMFLSEHAKEVHLIVRGGDLAKSMSSYLSNRVATKENIHIHYHTEVRGLRGETYLEGIDIVQTLTGERQAIKTRGLFLMIGAKPCTDWLSPEIWKDNRNFILTGAAVASAPAWQNAGRAPYPFETSQPGVFAAGDVRSGSVKRCSAAVGEGSMAIENVHQVLGTYS
ncbi:cyclic nucleotide-binding domain-containing protein [bacterium]|nr:MAG: cyclic nucleotide-binding domain-containing protein [bacterium]